MKFISYVYSIILLVVSIFILLSTQRLQQRLNSLENQHLRQYYYDGNTTKQSDGRGSACEPLLVIIQTQKMEDEVSIFVKQIMKQRPNTTVYITVASGSFGNKTDLWENNNNITARIVNCEATLCDSLVYSIVAYEVLNYVAIVRWYPLLLFNNAIHGRNTDSVIKSIVTAAKVDSLHPILFSDEENGFFLGILSTEVIRSVISSECFSVKYRLFNPITEILSYQSRLTQSHLNSSFKLSCSVRPPLSPTNSRSAVILTIYVRNYLLTLLPRLCLQSSPPSIIIFIQNMAYQSISMDSIPSECIRNHVEFHHIWFSNWNSYSFMRHYIPIPSDIHSTVLVDDDMFLTSGTLQQGISTMRENHCIATERGRIIDKNPNGHPDWPLVISANVSEVTLVDYAFIPLFIDTEWRKSVFKFTPFSRVYGDILFISIAIYQDKGISPCVIPHYDFFIRNEDGDEHSTSKKNKDLYNFHYNGIARMWQDHGYIPLMYRK